MTEIEALAILNRDDEDMRRGIFCLNDFEAIEVCKKALVRENADGCKGCAFEEVNEWELPCAKCKRNSKDYWRAKRGNEDAE